MSFSPELVALCQTQLNLFGQLFSAAQGVVYLATDNDRQWVPVASYPQRSSLDPLLSQGVLDIQPPPNVSGQPWPTQQADHPMGEARGDYPRSLISPLDPGLAMNASASAMPDQNVVNGLADLSQYQVVLPLRQGVFMVGVLVVSRDDRGWQDREYLQLQRVADTITWAGLMDRRLQWMDLQVQTQGVRMRQQQDLLDSLVHQIRNPLTALKTFGKLLLRRFLPEDPNQPIAEGIVKESDRLEFLIQQLQDRLGHALEVQVYVEDPRNETLEDSLGRDGGLGDVPRLLPSGDDRGATEMGEMGVITAAGISLGQLVPVDLVELVAPLVAAAVAIAEERGLEFQQRIQGTVGAVWGDPSILREVLSNLVDNALKYTPTGGKVTLTLCGPGQAPIPMDQDYQVVVSDTGPGIPPEDMPHLFEREYRGVQAQGTIAGTGLGLALAWDWVQAMGGTLLVLSPAGEWSPDPDAGNDRLGAAFCLALAWVKD